MLRRLAVSIISLAVAASACTETNHQLNADPDAGGAGGLGSSGEPSGGATNQLNAGQDGGGANSGDGGAAVRESGGDNALDSEDGGASAGEGGRGGGIGSADGGAEACPKRDGQAPCTGEEEAMCEQAAQERDKELIFSLDLASERDGASLADMQRNWDCVVAELEADGVDVPMQDTDLDSLVVTSTLEQVEKALQLEAVTGFGVYCGEELCDYCWGLELDECKADAFCSLMSAYPFDPDRQCVASGAPVPVGCTPLGEGTSDAPCMKRLADGALFIATSGSVFLASPDWGECSETESRLAVSCEDD